MQGAIEHFTQHGWMRIRSGLSAADARKMKDALWDALEVQGLVRDNPETWMVERPTHLQHLRKDPAFRWRPSPNLQQAIETIIGPTFDTPSDWGSAFIAFPSNDTWNIPQRGWHIDANYRSPLFPARGVKILALLAPVAARGGATQVVSNSHRLVHEWFRQNPPPASARSLELRSRFRAHPYIDALLSPGDSRERIGRFFATDERHYDLQLQVVELTGQAGDVFLMHPLLLHAASANSSSQPRLMLSGGITTNMWGWTVK